MRGPYVEFLLLFGFLLCTATTIDFVLNLCNSKVKCIEEEIQALLEFKQGLKEDYKGLLAFWVGYDENCCKWE
jgi:hypothetical protein